MAEPTPVRQERVADWHARVYDNAIGTQASHEADTVRRDQWRVSWLMWPPGEPQPRRSRACHDDEATARQQLEGLLEMADKHALRPCGGHVWNPALERRAVWESPWHEQPL